MKYGWLIGLLFWSWSLCAQHSAHIRSLERQRKEALEEIRKTGELLDKTQKTHRDFTRRLNLISQQILARKKVISLMNQEIQAIDLQIKEKGRKIVQLEKELEQKKSSYAQVMCKIHRRHASTDKLLFILSAESFGQSMRRIRYLHEFAQWQRRQGDEIIKRESEISLQQINLKKNREEKASLLASREKEQKNLVQEENDRKVEISKLNQQKSSLQAQLRKKRQQADQLQRLIQKEIAAEIARAEKASKAKPGTAGAGKKVEKRKAEVKGGYAMTEKELVLSKNFSSNRGRLPFPVTGTSHQIVGHFGEHQHADLKYVRLNNNGIDIMASTGADARAVFNGVVTSVFTISGYNKSIIIRHGNYLTVYSNLSDVYVQKGQKVSTRQAIGKIYMDTEDNNATVLHFQLWKEKAKQNPEPWLAQ